jgi:hypothetical protein
MNPDCSQRLEALPRWSWNAFSDKWDEGFPHLKLFLKQLGHCRVLQRYKSDDGYRLGQWVSIQRANKEGMNPDRRQRLEALLGWCWDVISDQWEEGFSHLKQFADREGHCRVLKGYESDDSYRLGEWVRTQRKRMDTMEPVRRQRLEALPGWVWKARK